MIVSQSNERRVLTKMPHNLKTGLFATTTMIGTAMACGRNKATGPTEEQAKNGFNEDIRKTTDLRRKLTESEKHKETVDQMMIWKY